MRTLQGPYAIRYDWAVGAGLRHPAHTFLDCLQSEAQAVATARTAFGLGSGTQLSLAGVAWCRITRGAIAWHRMQNPDTCAGLRAEPSSDDADPGRELRA